jgi:sensor domain CHASE-containing protein
MSKKKQSLKSCDECVNFSKKYGNDYVGTCGLDGVFVMSSGGCDRWDKKANQGTGHTTGYVADDLLFLTSEGTKADFG